MKTDVVRFIPHGPNSPEVRARLAEGAALHQKRVDAINARLMPMIPKFNKRATELVRSARSADYCIPEFWRLVDEMAEANKGNVACKRGCNHCCHTCVLVTQDEADVIGKRIGRKAVQIDPPGRTRGDGFDYGYHNPCTFLVDGECSIYENRPLACRLQYSVDIDSLLCELTPDEPPIDAVPYLNPLPFNKAFLQMLGVPHVVPVLADIREFFPKVNK